MTPPLVEVSQVSFAYSKSPRIGSFRLAGLTFEIIPGEILGVIGPNSSGKTTLIRLLTKVVRPSNGEIRLAGRPISGMTRWDVARQVAVGAPSRPTVRGSTPE